MADDQFGGTFQAVETNSDAKTWGMLCHVASFAGYVVPFGNVVGPLIAWQIKKDTSEFVNHHGKESLNFQITITIAMLVSIVLVLLLVGIFLLFIIPIFQVAFVIIAAIKAAQGEWYRYPLTIRFIK